MLGWGLTRFLPPSVRPYSVMIAEKISGVCLPPRIPRRHVKNPRGSDRIVVAGFLSMRTGLARGAHLMLLNLQNKSFNVQGVDLTDSLGMVGHQPFRGACAPRDLNVTSGDIVLHVNPPQFLQALRAFNPDVLTRNRIIGMWAWELEAVPHSWRRSALYCDEIWAPSPFVAAAIQRSIGPFPGAIRVVPHAIDADPFVCTTQERRAEIRSRFDLNQRTFVAGYSFSMASNYARKNPIGAIRAFQRAFPDNSDVRMYVRCNDDYQIFAAGWEELQEAADNDPRIILLTRDEIRSIAEFYALLDVYLSLHRSEGYGLQLVEAAQSGLSVVATGWGLAPEISAAGKVTSIGYQLVPVEDSQGTYSRLSGCQWADPDIDEAAEALRRLAQLRPGVPIKVAPAIQHAENGIFEFRRD